MKVTTTHLPSPNRLNRIQKLRLLALIPVMVAAVISSGWQYALLGATVDNIEISGWRDGLIRSLGFDGEVTTGINMLIPGMVLFVSTVLLALLAAGMVERIACSSLGRRFDTGMIYSALLFALLMPPSASPFHIFFGMTLGYLLGHVIFGGEGKTFLNPALVGVALVQISFPSAHSNDPVWSEINGYAGTKVFDIYHQQGPGVLDWAGIDWWSAFVGAQQGLLGTTSLLAILIGAVVLLYARVASWRLLVAQIAGLFIGAGLFNLSGHGIMAMPWHWHLVLGSFAFGAVFIATDPSSSAATNCGRWIQGLLIGLLVILLRVINPSHPDGVVPVLLLASMLAPTIDQIVISRNIRLRARRYG